MLNKIKKCILPMLDTLGEALAQYLSVPTEELRGGIFQFIDAINVQLENKINGIHQTSDDLKTAVQHAARPEIERCFDEYCVSIENHPVQYKVLFLPYYENTWDSLASVYEAFAADPMFVTEIVIIPIARNTPTGTKMVYHDYLTPLCIPNTHYDEYNIEEDRPDFVFYNNPYDGVNVEKFQTDKIKPYAGYMVYIPYFLYQHQYLNKEWFEKNLKQYTLLSGHDNADLIITQGESFMKTFARRSRNGKKMVALGNPKTDNIVSCRKDYTRYASWDRVTEGRTVFMLNTHYTLAANGGYKSLLPELLTFVEENERLALIWRPHPQSFLMFAENDKSDEYMEWERYLNRVNRHKRMILDRTPSDISAIMYSNAVISHLSSVIGEAVCADKPVFLLGHDLRESNAFLRLEGQELLKKLEQIRKYDLKNLYLHAAIFSLELCHVLPKEQVDVKYWFHEVLLPFMSDIQNGIDSKKELRAAYREQLLANADGTCGQKIHDYVVDGILSARIQC